MSQLPRQGKLVSFVTKVLASTDILTFKLILFHPFELGQYNIKCHAIFRPFLDEPDHEEKAKSDEIEPTTTSSPSSSSLIDKLKEDLNIKQTNL